MLGIKSSKVNSHSLGNKKNGQIFGIGHKTFQAGNHTAFPHPSLPKTQGNNKSYLEK
jgi:hypothetical protein